MQKSSNRKNEEEESRTIMIQFHFPPELIKSDKTKRHKETNRISTRFTEIVCEYNDHHYEDDGAAGSGGHRVAEGL